MKKQSRNVILAMSMVFAACAPRSAGQSASAPGVGIVGGKEVQSSDPRAAFVGLINGENTTTGSFFCTGTFISDKALLTAGHCVVDDLAKMNLMFGTNINLDSVVQLTVTAVVRYHGSVSTDADSAKKTASSRRDDLALVFFSGGLPKGARLVRYDGFPLSLTSGKFLALGYGRTEGNADQDGSEENGILRAVNLQAKASDVSDSQFKIMQESGKGVCFGDSGGPALMESAGQTYVVGVASGVVTSETDSGDQCKHQSIYLRVRFYSSWIKEQLANPPVGS